MAQPDWTKITSNGRPFGYQEESEKEALKLIEELKVEIDMLKKENQQLRQILEEDLKSKK